MTVTRLNETSKIVSQTAKHLLSELWAVYIYFKVNTLILV